MTAVLHLKPEEIDTKEKREKYAVGIIGCREKGIIYAVAFAEAGFRVICSDEDKTLVKNLAKGKTMLSDKDMESKLKRFLRKEQLCVIDEVKIAVSRSDIILLTISANTDGNKQSDYSEVEGMCRQIGRAMNRYSLVIYGGAAGVGFTEGIIKETLENTSGFKVGDDFGLVYNPIHFADPHPLESIANQEIKIAAMDRVSLNSGMNVLGTIAKKGVKQILDFKTAEAAMLFSIAKQETNWALANELAVFCEGAGLDYFKTLKLVDSQKLNFSPTVEAREDKTNETCFLLESAENLNVKLELPALARKINENMLRHAVNLTNNALHSCGKTLRRSRVGIISAAKPSAVALVRMLEKKGAKVNLYDPLLPKGEYSNLARMLKRSFKETVEGTDCLVIFGNNNQFRRLNLKKLQAVMKKPAAIVDLKGIIDPQRVESKGFAYRGLGRGVQKN
jgi:UDP-N-acetyl-D-mannosaminuronic acid dehydrogenase